MLAIKIMLGLTALYCGGMWGLCFARFIGGKYRLDDHEAVERHTFHLGLCFILAIGFLGLINSNGG